MAQPGGDETSGGRRRLSPRASPASGDVLASRYSIVARLGQGGMGEVFDVEDRIHREVGDRRFEGVLLGNMGVMDDEQGRLDRACEHLERALEIHREVGNRRFEAIVLGNLGSVDLEQGRLEEARDQGERALAIHREVGDRRMEGIVLGNLGSLHLRQGRVDESRQRFVEGERLLRAVGDKLELGKLPCGRGELAMRSGAPEAARSCMHEAEQLAASTGAGPSSQLGRQLVALRDSVQRHDRQRARGPAAEPCEQDG